jgi:MFS transporter, DHA3 family, macrolide efflux protein
LPRLGNEPGVFARIWTGQLISTLGSGLTAFALSVWVYQRTGSVTQFAAVPIFTTLPRILLAPFIGVAADRYDRRWLMIASDLSAAGTSLVLWALLAADRLAIWHIYLLALVTSACTAVRWPAYTSSITLLVPKENYGRANGLNQFGQAGASILAPMLAGFLLALIGLQGIILLDLVSFLVSVAALLTVRIPRPRPAEGAGRRETVRAQTAEAWGYLLRYRAFVELLVFFLAISFLTGMAGVLFTPLVLGFASAAALGTVVSTGGIGYLAGSLFMSVTGGPRPRVYGILGFGAVSALAMSLAGLRPSLLLVAAGSFLLAFGLPVINGSTEAVFQSKVPPALQGRAFALVRMISQSASPLAFLLAGPLADRVFEPLMAPGGALAASAGASLGVGKGRGIALLYVVVGGLCLLVAAWGFLVSRLRFLERDVPDAVVGGLPLEGVA